MATIEGCPQGQVSLYYGVHYRELSTKRCFMVSRHPLWRGVHNKTFYCTEVSSIERCPQGLVYCTKVATIERCPPGQVLLHQVINTTREAQVWPQHSIHRCNTQQGHTLILTLFEHIIPPHKHRTAENSIRYRRRHIGYHLMTFGAYSPRDESDIKR